MTDFSFDPTCPDFVRDPYPVYQWLRENDPAHRAKNGCWVLSRYADIDQALKDPVYSNAPHPFSIVGPHNRERFAASRIACNLMAFMDIPGHGAIRKAFNSRFHERMRDLKPMVGDLAKQCFARLPVGTPIDFLAAYANPLAVECICRFIGFPTSMATKLTEWSRELFHLFHAIPNREVLERVNASLVEFEEFVRAELRSRAHQRRDDLLSLLIDTGDLSEDETVHNLMLIAADGIGNVDVGLALAVCTLLNFPTEYNRLLERPDLIRSAVSECLRYDSPAQYQGRILAEPVQLHGKELPANSIVLLALASGNRDSAAASDADEFRIDRTGFRNLTFGKGVHACLGTALVSLQFEAVFEILAHSSKRFSLVEDTVQWVARAGHRWPKTLRVVLN